MTQHHQLQIPVDIDAVQNIDRPRSAIGATSTSPITPQTSTMVRSSSAEPTKSSKRKGPRSVSTLTPAQLARKRANDREAQRAIRARTREHIERLEQEVEELKGQQGRDKTVQELLRRNKALEEELGRLREARGMPMTPSAYSTPVYDDALSTTSGVVASPRSSPFTGDFTSMPDLSQSFVAMPSNCEAWASAVANPVHSNVSSPSSTAANDDYTTAANAPGYIPTSVPSSIMPQASKDIKLETGFEDVDAKDAFRLTNTSMPVGMTHFMHHQQSASPVPQQAQHSPWAMPYSPVYYPQVQSPVH